MIYAAIWRDLRWRMLGALPFVVLLPALLAFTYAHEPNVAGAPTFIEHFGAAWFELPGPAAVFLVIAVLVSAAGSLVRPRADIAYLFALPISRRRWLLSHVAASLLAVGALLVVADLILCVGAWSSGRAVQLLPLLGRSLLVLFAAGVWSCLTLGAVALVRVPVLAASLVFGVDILVPGAGRFHLSIPPKPNARMLSAWDPWALADPRAWQGGVPVASIASAIVVATVALVVAVYLLERYEP